MTDLEKQARGLVNVLKRHFPTAKKAGISYSGEGDSGQIDYITVDDKYLTKTYKEIEDAVYNLTFANVSGDNEGGGGEITVDLEALLVTRTEYWNELFRHELPEEKVQLW